MSTTPTQVARPWRATFRTVIQVGIPVMIGLGLVVPQIVAIVLEEAGETMPDEVRVWLLGIAAACVAASAIITRIMAIPQVELLLREWLPRLAADQDE